MVLLLVQINNECYMVRSGVSSDFTYVGDLWSGVSSEFTINHGFTYFRVDFIGLFYYALGLINLSSYLG
jgi:hypothetical protein